MRAGALDAQQIFVPGVGQYDNIGDIILRRQLIDWLRPLGELHIFVGDAPRGYSEALGVTPADVVYSGFARWYGKAIASAVRGCASYIFKPGEIQLTLVGMKEHVGMLPLQMLVKLTGGKVARVGAGSRDFAPLPRLMMRPSLALTDLVVWRDQRTADYLRSGSVMPDLAFGEGDSSSWSEPGSRDLLIVSMRGDRPAPGAAWLAGVAHFAEARGLAITVVTQVARDAERSRDLTRLLEADLLDWDGVDHQPQEDALRALYRRAAIVVSDRLHVLVTAFTEGAMPIALLTEGSDKIDRHFSAAGISRIAVDVSDSEVQEIVRALDDAVSRRPEALAGLGSAREELTAVRRRLEVLLGAGGLVGSAVRS